MKYKVTIKSTPEFSDVVIARTVAEAKRIATRNALVKGIKVLYSDDVWIEDIE